MGILAPEFWISTEEMQAKGLPETFDFLRFDKDCHKVPFVCIHTDDQFMDMLSWDAFQWPDDIDASATSSKITNRLPGVYRMSKFEVPPEPVLNDDGTELPPPSAKESFMEHLQNMKDQHLELDNDEQTFRRLLSRENLEKQKHFVYKENLVFSVMDRAAAANPDFPQKWNFNKLPGPLKSFCTGNGGVNEILGVSSAMIYAGTIGTFCAWHVEDADFPSANLLLRFSAGKAWIGICPEDQWKIDEYIRQKFRRNCCSPCLHKDISLDIDLLDELRVRWYYFIQRPGDIILTNPACPHQVVNLGFNLAESTNFYVSRHLVAARRRLACKCPLRIQRYDNDAWKRIATFVYSGEFQFLCKVNGIPVPSPEEVCSQILDEIADYNGHSLDETSHPLTVAEAIQNFTQSFLEQNPSKKPDDNVTVVQILSSAPLDLNAILPPPVSSTENQHPEESPTLSTVDPGPSTAASPQAQVENVRQVPLSSEIDEPVVQNGAPRSRSTTPRSNTPPPQETARKDSYDIFQISSPERSPSPIRGRKRKSKEALFEDPSQKARRLNSKADYWSQRNHDRHQMHRQPPPSPSPSTSSRVSLDPRLKAAERIETNMATYEKYKGSRRASNIRQKEKHGKQKIIRTKTSAWFNDYLQRATRKIAVAEKKIAEYAARGTKPRYCNWEEKLASAEEAKINLERRRLLQHVLKQMYDYCSEDLQERLDEGYLEQEIFRDFVSFHCDANKKLLQTCLKAHHADLDYWTPILQHEEAWNAEFGVDAKYRIPCVEFNVRLLSLSNNMLSPIRPVAANLLTAQNPITRDPTFGEIWNYDASTDRLSLKILVLEEFDASTHCFVVSLSENVIEVSTTSLVCPELLPVYRKSRNYIRMPYYLPLKPIIAMQVHAFITANGSKPQRSMLSYTFERAKVSDLCAFVGTKIFCPPGSTFHVSLKAMETPDTPVYYAVAQDVDLVDKAEMFITVDPPPADTNAFQLPRASPPPSLSSQSQPDTPRTSQASTSDQTPSSSQRLLPSTPAATATADCSGDTYFMEQMTALLSSQGTSPAPAPSSSSTSRPLHTPILNAFYLNSRKAVDDSYVAMKPEVPVVVNDINVHDFFGIPIRKAALFVLKDPLIHDPHLLAAARFISKKTFVELLVKAYPEYSCSKNACDPVIDFLVASTGNEWFRNLRTTDGTSLIMTLKKKRVLLHPFFGQICPETD